MNATYTYHPGSENICRACNGFLRWPDGLRLSCRCTTPEPSLPNPEHVYWTETPYRTREEEVNIAEGWRDGDALAS